MLVGRQARVCCAACCGGHFILLRRCSGDAIGMNKWAECDTGRAGRAGTLARPAMRLTEPQLPSALGLLSEAALFHEPGDGALGSYGGHFVSPSYCGHFSSSLFLSLYSALACLHKNACTHTHTHTHTHSHTHSHTLSHTHTHRFTFPPSVSLFSFVWPPVLSSSLPPPSFRHCRTHARAHLPQWAGGR